jgi:outer membrane protein assembly factor BamD
VKLILIQRSTSGIFLRSVLFLALTAISAALFSACAGSSTQNTNVTATPVQAHFEEGKRAFEKGEWAEAVRIFEEVRIQSPTSEVAAEATYLEAMARFKQELYSGAAIDFQSTRINYPSSPYAARAQFMVGESYYRLSPRFELDQTYSLRSLAEFQVFLREFPRSTSGLQDSAQQRITEIRNKLALKILQTAELYMKLEEPKSALIYFAKVLDQFYDSQYAPEAELRIAEVSYDRHKAVEAQDALHKFEDKYLQTATPDLRQRAMQLRQKLGSS